MSKIKLREKYGIIVIMGTLYIVSTPIGNLEDITLRALRIIFSVDYIACEDTRRCGQLLQIYDSRFKNKELIIKDFDLREKPKLISYYDEIEFKRVPEIIDLLNQENDVALLSDSGTPLVSDPGFKLVQECLKRGMKVVSIPGSTSLIAALTSSGLPPNNFWFFGYLPAKREKRLQLCKNLYQCLGASIIKPTVIFFETPHRIANSLATLKEVFGDRQIAIARELTKIHEEVFRGKISEAIKYFQNPRGEFVILFSTPPELKYHQQGDPIL